MMRSARRIPLVWGVVLGLAVVEGSRAHETDQFLMPEYGEATFADLGPYFNEFFVDAVQRAVERTNASIAAAIARNAPPAEVASLQSEEALARAMRQALPDAVFYIEDLERRLPSSSFQQRYPDQVTLYKKHFEDGMHTGLHAPWDPRIVSRLFRAGTIRMYDTYLGTDKVGHLIDMGYHYYGKYREGLRAGESPAEAMQRAVRFGSDGFPLFAERAVLGKFTSGAYSNADMASNYVGCLFYRNLTETVELKGRPHPPMATLGDDGLWRLAPFVSKDNTRFFDRFVSDHLNEALNPSLFDKDMRPRAHKAIHNRRDNLLQWYADDQGQPRPAAYFTRMVEWLSTYYGQDYGHSGQFNDLRHLGNTVDPPR